MEHSGVNVENRGFSKRRERSERAVSVPAGGSRSGAIDKKLILYLKHLRRYLRRCFVLWLCKNIAKNTVN